MLDVLAYTLIAFSIVCAVSMVAVALLSFVVAFAAAFWESFARAWRKRRGGPQ